MTFRQFSLRGYKLKPQSEKCQRPRSMGGGGWEWGGVIRHVVYVEAVHISAFIYLFVPRFVPSEKALLSVTLSWRARPDLSDSTHLSLCSLSLSLYHTERVMACRCWSMKGFPPLMEITTSVCDTVSVQPPWICRTVFIVTHRWRRRELKKLRGRGWSWLTGGDISLFWLCWRKTKRSMGECERDTQCACVIIHPDRSCVGVCCWLCVCVPPVKN